MRRLAMLGLAFLIAAAAQGQAPPQAASPSA
jgi:hypothetical protein